MIILNFFDVKPQVESTRGFCIKTQPVSEEKILPARDLQMSMKTDK